MKKKDKLICLWWTYIILLFLFFVIKFSSVNELVLRIKAYKAPDYINYNLVPFRTIIYQIERFPGFWPVINLFGNLLAFVPFGYILPEILEEKYHMWSFWHVLRKGFFFIIGIEVFQLITYIGNFDIDDIILNTVSVVIGFAIWKISKNTKLRENK